jgi:hypothetical protein
VESDPHIDDLKSPDFIIQGLTLEAVSQNPVVVNESGSSDLTLSHLTCGIESICR